MNETVPTEAPKKTRTSVLPPPEILGTLYIPADQIRPMPDQPRRHFDSKKIEQLAASIGEGRQRQLVQVRPISGDPDHKYELMDGERRWRACQKAGLPVHSIVMAVKDRREQYLHSLSANFGREPHTPIEMALGVKQALILNSEEYEGLSKDEIYQRLGDFFAKSAAWAYQMLQLLELSPEVQELVDRSPEHERRLQPAIARRLRIFPAENQIKLANYILDRGLNLKQSQMYLMRQERGLNITREGVRGRRPSDDYKLIFALLVRMDLTEYLKMPGNFFQGMFRNRPPQDHGILIRQLDARVAQLRKLRAILLECKPGAAKS